MESYNLIDGFNEHGEDIVLRPSWEHKTSELRFLAAAEDEEHPLVKVLSTTNFTKDGDAYTFHYPFEFAGLPWRVFAWRVTTENGRVDYTEGRVPVEAILTKISELSAKADEFGLLYRRALKAPEDMAGKMIVPLKKLRLGKVLGFDDDGLPICGLKNIREAKEFLDEMKRILDEAKAALEEMKRRIEQALKDMRDLGDKLKGELEALRDACVEALNTLFADLEASLRATHEALETSLRETCESLSASMRELSEQLKGDMSDEASRLIGEIRAAADSMAEDLNALFGSLKQSLSDHADALGAALSELEQNALTNIGAAKDAAVEEVNEAGATNLDIVNNAGDEKVSEIERVGDEKIAAAEAQAEAARKAQEAAQNAREGAEAAQAASEAAQAVCEALAGEIRNLGANVESTYEEILSIQTHLEELYAELTRYRYEVLTREEYEAKKAAGTLEADVIYFVKGTVAINDTLERLEEALSSLSEAYAELSARHDADVAALEGTIQATSDALDAAFAEATAAIEALEGKHDAESLAATQRLNVLQGGLQTLKARVDALQGQADASTAGVAENAAGIAELQQSLTEKTDALRGLIDALATQVGDGDAENNAVARGLLERMAAAEAKNDEQDAGIAGNAGEIAALKAQLEAALNDDIPTLLDFYTQAIADLQAKSGVATMTFSGTSKLSTATVMDVNDGKVGHDSNGALRVASASRETNGTVYLPTHEWSALSNAAASLVLLRKKANALSIEGGATPESDNCNQYSFVGPLTSLGVTGACADLNTVTFYRRANSTPNGSTQVYLRLLKKVVGSDGNKTWQIASQSVNAVSFAAQARNGLPCGTFYMKRAAGVEPPTCDETVALVVVGAADAEVTTGLQFGCKVRPSTTGGVCTSAGLGSSITMDKGGLAVVPMLDITWTPCAATVGDASYDAKGLVQLSLTATQIDDPLGIGKQPDGRIVADMAQVRAVVNAAVAGIAAAIEARVAELETARTALENADAAIDARVAALEAAASGGDNGDAGSAVEPVVETTLTEVVYAYTKTSVFETVTETVVKVDNAVDSEGNPVGVETMTEIVISLPSPGVGETTTETLTVIYPTRVDVLTETLVQLPTIVEATETTLTETVVE